MVERSLLMRRSEQPARAKGQAGLTLIELLLAVTILSVISLAFYSITHATLQSWQQSHSRDEATQAGRAVLDRIADRIRETTRVLLPFQLAIGDTSTHHVLCVALGIDNDGDGRVDEDSWHVYTDMTASGLPGIDDDWDGLIDEEEPRDDDESGWTDEDALDGVTNDGDDRIDEDWGSDMNGDGEPGVAYVDDDGDGMIDEGSASDNDEDGDIGEDPIEPLAYYVDPSERPPQLVERDPTSGTTVLARNLFYPSEENYADGFIVTRITLQNGVTLLHLTLRLETEAGEVVQLQTTVIARNCVRRPDWGGLGELPI